MEIPVIPERNCLSLAGSEYNVAKRLPPVLTSFWGLPVRRPSVSDPQKPDSRALLISSIPPVYVGLFRSRKRSVSGVLEYFSPSRFNMPSARSEERRVGKE